MSIVSVIVECRISAFSMFGEKSFLSVRNVRKAGKPRVIRAKRRRSAGERVRWTNRCRWVNRSAAAMQPEKSARAPSR